MAKRRSMAEAHVWRLWERIPFLWFRRGISKFWCHVFKMIDWWRLRDAGTHTLSVVSATRACARTPTLSRVSASVFLWSSSLVVLLVPLAAPVSPLSQHFHIFSIFLFLSLSLSSFPLSRSFRSRSPPALTILRGRRQLPQAG